MIEYLFLFLAVLPGLEPGTTRLQYYYNFRYQASSWVLSPPPCKLDTCLQSGLCLRHIISTQASRIKSLHIDCLQSLLGVAILQVSPTQRDVHHSISIMGCYFKILQSSVLPTELQDNLQLFSKYYEGCNPNSSYPSESDDQVAY